TRNWDDARGITYSTRSKEQAHDYRYLPDPDLVPLRLDPQLIERWRQELPELPLDKRDRLMREQGLSAYDAGILTEDRVTADFFEDTVRAGADPKQTANWLLGDIRRLLEKNATTLAGSALRPQQLAQLVGIIKAGQLSGKAAKEVCEVLVREGGDPQAIVNDRGLAQVSDSGALAKVVDDAIGANAESVAAYQAGKAKALEFIVGQIMKASRGKANIDMVRALLKERLG
ncbi:MAG: Asp-tRNA(Asn)/Glu-tRNA(Gln) amidotransferase GatCAB subunit B, partial [Candidatus Eremiobacteraeota bacterium]|nr:Asp-tRNA(Asn)/Glu-tRNA(Gln) amidotransferase GatCAB subunit B [Candidatus Eremiobacteraeota bacterium]